MKNTFLSLLFMLSMIFCFSQDIPSTSQNNLVPFSDSSDLILPILIQAALKNAPQLAVLNTGKKDARDNLLLAKKEFLRNFSLRSGYSYGNVNTILPNDGQVTPIYYYGDRTQFTYTVGASLGINLEQLFGGKKLRVDKQKIAIEEAQAELEQGEKEIKKQVISLYQNLKLARVLLLHNQDALQTAYVNKTLAEKQFKEGNLQITEQMTVDQLYTNALMATEQAKNTYQTNLLLMEELVGMPVSPLFNKYLNH